MRELTKVLHLVEPETIEQLGITDPVESPVFISPYWLHTDTCPACQATIGPLIYALGHETTTRHTNPDCPGIFVAAYAGASQDASPWLAAAVGHNLLTRGDKSWQQGYTLETYTSITLTSLLGFCAYCLAPCSSSNTALIKRDVTTNLSYSYLPDNLTTLWPYHDKCLTKLKLDMSDTGLANPSISEWRYNAQTNAFFRPSLASAQVPPVFNY